MSRAPFEQRAIYLGAAAIGAVAIAALIGIVTIDRREPSFVPEPYFPQIQAKAQETKHITVQDKSEKLELVYTPENGWSVANRDGYPAKFGDIQKLVMGLANMQRLAPRTTLEKWHDRLQLGDPNAGGNGVLIELRASGDAEPLAAIIRGKVADFAPVDGASFAYARTPGDAAVWLVQSPAMATLSTNAEDWIDTDIPGLATKSVREFSITPFDGPSYTARKASADDVNFALVALADGATPKSDSVANELGGALDGLILRDVAARDRIDFKDNIAKAVYTDFDGLRLSAELTKLGEDYWMRLTPSLSDDATDTAKAQQTALDKRLSAWVFQIDSWRGNQLTKPLSDLLEDKTPETSPESGEASEQ